MDTINITPERFQQALAWMNGQASTLGEQEVLQMLRCLTGRFQENCRALRPGPVARFRNLTLKAHPLSLTAIIAETEERIAEEKAGEAASQTDENPFLKELLSEEEPVVTVVKEEVPVALTPEQAVMEKVAQESRLDSVLLINSIAYVGALAGYPLTQSKAQIILYCLYGARLGAGEDRLPIEHPQVWKYGPVFPRAYKRGSIEDRGACEGSYQELLEKEPAILTALSTKTQSMMATPMADLNAVHKSAQSPYGRTKARFPEKWGAQIPDEEIAAFFKSRMTG
jgi:uncharacterized phage-associated protein